jgi:amidase
MARYVEDLHLLTPIMAGPDFRDAVVVPMPWPDYRKINLKGLKVAFFTENTVADTAEDVKQTVKKTAGWLEEAGAEVTEDLPRDLLVELGTIRRNLIVGDGWSWLLRTVKSKGSKAYGDSLEGRLEHGGSPISSAEYTRQLELQDSNRSAMLQWFSKYDLLICPVAGKAAGLINVGEKEGSYYMDNPGESYTKPFNTCGWPSAVVRCGTSEDNMPIGVQCVAHPWREDISLAAAAYLESRSGGWQKPIL